MAKPKSADETFLGKASKDPAYSEDDESTDDKPIHGEAKKAAARQLRKAMEAGDDDKIAAAFTYFLECAGVLEGDSDSETEVS